jgi:hypothetical protein
MKFIGTTALTICLLILLLSGCKEQPFMTSNPIMVDQIIGVNDKAVIPIDHTQLVFTMPDISALNETYLESYKNLDIQVKGKSISFLCDTSVGFCSALSEEQLIGEDGNWHKNEGMIGTMIENGPFRGVGDRYLGVCIEDNGAVRYGWVLINLTQNRDSLKIISLAVNNNNNQPICSGVSDQSDD